MASVQLAEKFKTPLLWNDLEMRRLYGTNLSGDPIFRVVQADTRDHMVGGRWKDRDSRPDNDKEFIQQGLHDKSVTREVCEYRWVPLYPGHHGWVVERWMSAEEFAGSPTIYHLTNFDEDSGLYATGPYPSSGVYVEVLKIPKNLQPTMEIVSRIIWLAQKSREYSYQAKLSAHKREAEKQEQDQYNRNDDILREARKKTLKRTQVLDVLSKLRHSAEDLRMPTQHGQFFTQDQERKIILCQG